MMKPLHAAPLNPLLAPKLAVPEKVKYEDAPPEMRKAAEGLEAAFTEQMVKAMRETVEPSEFSLHNHASDIYQSMLDQEYSESAARTKSLGLAEQIVDYMLRSQPQAAYTKGRSSQHHDGSGASNAVLKQEAKGNKNEDQSKQ